MENTPELSDGYEGVVKKLVCLDCQNPFYVARDDYERIHPQYCHNCSLQRFGVADEKAKKPVPKETLEQPGQDAPAEEMKMEVMSPEDKMVLYAVLQEIADELRRIDRERRKQQRLQESQTIDTSASPDV